jgi:hypothetical protein
VIQVDLGLRLLKKLVKLLRDVEPFASVIADAVDKLERSVGLHTKRFQSRKSHYHYHYYYHYHSVLPSGMLLFSLLMATFTSLPSLLPSIWGDQWHNS